jgi:replicative DNA helicase
MTNHSAETEKALLGYILYNPDDISIVKPIIEELNYFTAYAHKLIYATMLDLEPETMDEIAIGGQLKRQGKLKQCGGYKYLAELAEYGPEVRNPVYCAKVLKENYVIREAAKEADRIKKLVLSPVEDATISAYDMLGQGIKNLQALQASLGARKNKVLTVSEVFPQIIKEMEQAAKGEIKPAMSTGLESLDLYLGGGLYESEMNIIAARPSVGKTSAAVAIAENLSPEKKILFISLETTAASIVRDRLLPSKSKIISSNIRMPNRLNPEDWDNLFAVGSEIGAYKNFKICEQSSMTIADIEELVRQEATAKNGGIDLLIIDYMQLIRGAGTFRSREERVADTSQRLKALIKEYGLRSLVLAQLNRESQKQNRWPRISDLRESGQIEQDADSIIILHEEQEDLDNGTLKIGVAKNRNGPQGRMTVRFNRRITRVEDCGATEF